VAKIVNILYIVYSCDMILQTFSWISGLAVVLKFLKFHSCPEILLIGSECPDMDLCYAVTSHNGVYVADVECQVMFSLVTLCCSMCNIALVTLLGLQY